MHNLYTKVIKMLEICKQFFNNLEKSGSRVGSIGRGEFSKLFDEMNFALNLIWT